MLEDTLRNFKDKLQSSGANEKLRVLSVLAHNITVGLRMALTEPQIKTDKLYALNEVQHRLTARLADLQEQSDEWDEGGFAELLLDYASSGDCEAELDFAVRQTLKADET